MLEKSTIARPYAQAAFSQAKEEGALEPWARMLARLKLLAADPSMRALFHHPRMDERRLCECILGFMEEPPSQTMTNFITLLARAQRLETAPEIHDLFAERRAREEGEIQVHIRSAFPLSHEQQTELAKLLGQRYGKRVQPQTEVDESLIGGVVIRIGDTVIDASVSGHLQSLGNIVNR